jgi:hypothetical protein
MLGFEPKAKGVEDHSQGAEKDNYEDFSCTHNIAFLGINIVPAHRKPKVIAKPTTIIKI